MTEVARVATVRQVKDIDLKNNTFDGEKADLFINTGQIGEHFLVTVNKPDGRPTLIAIHL